MLLASVLASAVTVGVLFLVMLSRTPPSWWRVIDSRHPRTLDSARTIEAGVINAMHKRRDADPAFLPTAPGQYRSSTWRHELDAASASAWLSAKLPRWIDSRGFSWPDEMAEIQVEFREGSIKAGALITTSDSGRRFVSLTLVPIVDEDGSLWLRAEGVRIGRLPLPGRLAGQWAGRWTMDGDAFEPDLLLAKLAGEEPFVESAGVRLSDGRRVRLIDVRPRAGRLELTCATEKGL